MGQQQHGWQRWQEPEGPSNKAMPEGVTTTFPVEDIDQHLDAETEEVYYREMRTAPDGVVRLHIWVRPKQMRQTVQRQEGGKPDGGEEPETRLGGGDKARR